MLEFQVTVSTVVVFENEDQIDELKSLAKAHRMTVEKLLTEEPSLWWSQLVEDAHIDVEDITDYAIYEHD